MIGSRSMIVRHAGVLVTGALALSACGGAPAPGAKLGEKGLLERAHVTCNAAEQGVSDLFTVEWDATRVAQFEAIAARDTVIVHFERCKVSIIEGCNDDRIPAKLGAYGTPMFTSGAEKELVIRNRDDLHAELPLGFATLGGRIDSGEQLRLKYFVTGVGKATRGNLYDAELAKIPECAGASHFVASYELGAFALESATDSTLGVAAKAGGRAAGGGSSQRSEASLAHAGSIASCASRAKDGCRVPIRLHLKKIRSGAAPADEHASAVEAKMGPSIADDFFAWHEKMLKLQGEAREKLAAGDGAGCLRVLAVDLQFKERAARNDAHRAAYLVNHSTTRGLEARCLAATGNCSEAVKTHVDSARLGEQTLAASGFRSAPRSDADIEYEAKGTLSQWCKQLKD